MPRRRTPPDPFRWFDSSPEVIRYVVMLYVRYPLSLRNVEDLLHERGIDICHETVRSWWIRFGPMFAAEIRRKRVQAILSPRATRSLLVLSCPELRRGYERITRRLAEQLDPGACPSAPKASYP